MIKMILCLFGFHRGEFQAESPSGTEFYKCKECRTEYTVRLWK